MATRVIRSDKELCKPTETEYFKEHIEPMLLRQDLRSLRQINLCNALEGKPYDECLELLQFCRARDILHIAYKSPNPNAISAAESLIKPYKPAKPRHELTIDEIFEMLKDKEYDECDLILMWSCSVHFYPLVAKNCDNRHARAIALEFLDKNNRTKKLRADKSCPESCDGTTCMI